MSGTGSLARCQIGAPPGHQEGGAVPVVVSERNE